MSFYNMIHGVNPMAGLLLSALGLTQQSVGRFRDCYWNGEHICVYTRNGGGNRECWHDPELGNEDCGGESYQVEVDETVYVTEAEAKEKGYQLLNVFCGSTRLARTGQRVMETRHKCLQPNSERCACPGCTINYRLPLHAQYIRDEDDDFDSTYATIFFKPSDTLREALTAVPATDATPEQRWQSFFERLNAGADDPQVARVLEGVKPMMLELATAVGAVDPVGEKVTE